MTTDPSRATLSDCPLEPRQRNMQSLLAQPASTGTRETFSVPQASSYSVHTQVERHLEVPTQGKTASDHISSQQQSTLTPITYPAATYSLREHQHTPPSLSAIGSRYTTTHMTSLADAARNVQANDTRMIETTRFSHASQEQSRYNPSNAQQRRSNSSATRETGRPTETQATRQVSTTRVIGRETGPHRLVSVTERKDESCTQVLNERTSEREIRVPRRILREEIIEKVIIVPEKKIVEEIVDEIQTVKETVIEVAKPTIVEKVIEVPEIEIVEVVVPVPTKQVRERIVEVPEIVKKNRYVGEPETIYKDRFVDVPVEEVKWIDVPKPYETIVWQDEIVYVDVPVPQYRTREVPREVRVEVPVDVHRDLPVPVEAEVSYEYRLPQLKPRYAKVTYPVYLPRFIEVPVAAEMLSPDLIAKAKHYMSKVNEIRESKMSMCEVEKLAASIIATDFSRQIASADLQVEILKAWQSGSIDLSPKSHTRPIQALA